MIVKWDTFTKNRGKPLNSFMGMEALQKIVF
ncbi:hypothetical protein MELB17_09393 [Marinobacter sp. ELB17]|nr:hypothetical protein MELB17_09393 [Marinobacter sp. ELB17]